MRCGSKRVECTFVRPRFDYRKMISAVRLLKCVVANVAQIIGGFDGHGQSWTRLSEQFFRFDMWSSAGVRLPSGEAAA